MAQCAYQGQCKSIALSLGGDPDDYPRDLEILRKYLAKFILANASSLQLWRLVWAFVVSETSCLVQCLKTALSEYDKEISEFDFTEFLTMLTDFVQIYEILQDSASLGSSQRPKILEKANIYAAKDLDRHETIEALFDHGCLTPLTIRMDIWDDVSECKTLLEFYVAKFGFK